MFVCLCGHPRLNSLAETMFSLLLVPIKVLLILHKIYVSRNRVGQRYIASSLLETHAVQPRWGTPSPPAPFSPRIALPPGMLLSTISVTQHLYTFRKKCFLLQESFLEMSAFGEAAQAACVDPVGSIWSRPHSPVLLVSTSVRLLPLLHPRPAGPGAAGEGVGVASRHVGLNCIPSLLALCSWESLLDFPSLCVLIN